MQKYQQPSYVFIAGGIGVTPFRSMIQYMIDKQISAPVTLFYTAHIKEEFIFQDIFDKAAKSLDLKTICILSKASPAWNGETGHIDEAMIKKYVKDVAEPIFYISGPQPMVEAYRELLQKVGVKKIKTDLFTGYEES